MKLPRRALVLLVLCAWTAGAIAQECAADAAGAHSSTTVVYSRAGGISEATVFTASIDGTVHAVDARTGAALWAFTPPEAIGSSAASDLITDIRILRFDANNDGTIDVARGDKVWLFFGLRRAGPYYYALDITDRNTPRVRWSVSADTLDHLGDAWSTPTIARVRIAGAAQNGEHFVLIFGGGYRARAALGNRLFMVDAATGDLLWSVGAADGTRAPDLVLDEMTHAVPARVAVLDTDGDGFADRMYAIDVSGLLWRFDIWNGHSRSTLVTGGVFADLSTDTLTIGGGAERFFSAPDVSLIQPRGGTPYYNIAFGSGAANADAATDSHDFFYSIRDRAPFEHRAQSAYQSATVVRAQDLVDISAAGREAAAGATVVGPDAPGWRIDLDHTGAGERVAGESITVNGVVLFTTLQSSSAADACEVASSRVYAVRVDMATAALDLNDDDEITAADRSMALPWSGAPGDLSVEIVTPDAPLASDALAESASGAEPSDPGTPLTTRCLVGSHVLPACVPVNALVRTYWQRPAVN